MSLRQSARFAVLVLALSAPLAVAIAPVANASGGSAVVGAVLTTGNVHVQSTKGLSRVTVVLCDGVTVVADDWSEDQKSGDVEVGDIVQAVFIHSGDNTTTEAQALLALLAGATAVKGNSTGAIAFYDDDACDEPEESTTTTTTTTTTVTQTEESSTTTTTTGTETPTTVTTASTSSTTSPTTPTTAIQTTVLGETLEKAGQPPASSLAPAVSPATLPRTGAGHMMFLLTLAAGLIAAGIALLSVFRRREAASASSPC